MMFENKCFDLFKYKVNNMQSKFKITITCSLKSVPTKYPINSLCIFITLNYSLIKWARQLMEII